MCDRYHGLIIHQKQHITRNVFVIHIAQKNKNLLYI
ncbi:MAG: hypothetical protein Ta2E_02520 [Mycoplasmoidaceae bacterium]|nr:MAG: hypothetical protein Ta2E_02520 [Mycoplasmoidaceae bacterium]